MSDTERTTTTLRQDFANLRLLFSIAQHIVTVIIPSLTESQLRKLAWEEIIEIPILDPEITLNLEICEDSYGDLTALYMSLSELADALKIQIDIDRNENYNEHDFPCREPKYILSINAFTESICDNGDSTHSETYILPNIAMIATKDTPKPPDNQRKKAEFN